MLSAITTYNNIDGLHGLRSMPQYGFNRGMKKFGQEGYNATASEMRYLYHAPWMQWKEDKSSRVIFPELFYKGTSLKIKIVI